MLTHRTNVLLTKLDREVLSRLASKKGKTVGELIRQAVRKTYNISQKENSTAWALQQIDRLAKKVNTKGINYRQLIEHGRKY